MDDLISRQAAIDALENDKAALDKIIKGMSAMDVRLDAYVSQRNQVVYDIYAIKQLPPIQPEIVRCKDCKYAEYIDDVQTLWCTECGQGRTVAPNDFCSYAERREVTT